MDHRVSALIGPRGWPSGLAALSAAGLADTLAWSIGLSAMQAGLDRQLRLCLAKKFSIKGRHRQRPA